MTNDDAFVLTSQIIERKPAFVKALKHLSPSTEIRILIEGNLECALLLKDQKAVLEKRPAPKADVEFTLYPEAIRRLETVPGEDFGEFGVDVLREIAAGHIQVRVCGKVMNVLTKGYLTLIKEAGPGFTKFLAQHGLTRIPKIISVIKKLKK